MNLKLTNGEINSFEYLPMNYAVIGKVSRDDIKVYIKNDIYNKIKRKSLYNKNKEFIRILFGSYLSSNNKEYTIVTDFIDIKTYSDKITDEIWERVEFIHKQKFAGKKIVGWQHVMPGFGALLSNDDILVHEKYFRLPWQVLLVYDPEAEVFEAFQRKGSKLSKCGGYYLFNDMGNEIKPANKKLKKHAIFIIGLLIIIASVAVLMNSFYSKNENDSVDKKLDGALNSLSVQSTESPIETAVPKAQTDEVKAENTETGSVDIPENTEGTGDTESADVVKFKSYVFQDGDTLAGICERFGIDYGQIGLIMGVSGIKNPRMIHNGQVIYLPIK